MDKKNTLSDFKIRTKYDENYRPKDYTLEEIMNEYGKNKKTDNVPKQESSIKELADILSGMQTNESEKELSKVPAMDSEEISEDIKIESNPLKEEQGIKELADKLSKMEIPDNDEDLSVKEEIPENEDTGKSENNETMSLETKEAESNQKYFTTGTIDFLNDEIEEKDDIRPFEEEGKALPGFFDEEEDDEPSLEVAEKKAEPVIEDFEDESDIDSIKNDLRMQKRGLIIKTLMILILSGLSFYLGSASALGLYLPSVLNPISNILVFGFANSVLTFVLAIICFNIIIDGFAAFKSFKFSNDTLPALAIIATLIHSISVAFIGSGTGTAPVLYNGVAALSMAFIMFGKYLFVSNVSSNFKIASSEGEKLACNVIKNSHSLKALYKEDSDVCVIKPVKIVSGFLERSFDNDPSESFSQKFGFISFIIIIITTVLMAFMKERSYILLSLAASSVIASSFMAELSFSLPFSVISKKIRKFGGAIIGYDSTSAFDKTETLVVRDTDLFPKEKTAIYSMKIIDKSKIDEVIVNAASLMFCAGGPLSDAFVRILDKKEGMLREVSEFSHTEWKGVSGVIEGVRYFAGNAEYLCSCGIAIPNENYETKYGRGGKSVLLFGSENKILAVFVVSYGISEKFNKIIKKLDSSSFTLCIMTKDQNITEALVEAKYGIYRTPIIIPGKNEAKLFEEYMQPEEKLPAKIISSGGAAGICTALEACSRVKSAVKFCVWIRTAGILVGGLIILYLSIISQVPITPSKIVLFQLLWMVPFLFTVIFKSR